MKIGNRIIFDQDGELIYTYGEMTGDVFPRKELTSINMIDLDYGEVDYSTHKIVKIDIDTMKPIIEPLPHLESDEQRQIRELEDMLLMQADADLGGIL